MDKQHSGKAATASIFAQTYQNPLPKIGASFGMKVAAWRIVGLYCLSILRRWQGIGGVVCSVVRTP